MDSIIGIYIGVHIASVIGMNIVVQPSSSSSPPTSPTQPPAYPSLEPSPAYSPDKPSL
jgi:hypothetical protein